MNFRLLASRIALLLVPILFTALLLSQMAEAQGRPDILWMRGIHNYIQVCKYSADGQFILTSGAYSDIKIRRSSDGTIVRTLEAFSYSTIDCDLSREGDYVVATGKDYENGVFIRRIKQFRVSDGSVMWVNTIAGDHVKYAPDAQTIVSAYPDVNYILNAADGGFRSGGYSSGSSTFAISNGANPILAYGSPAVNGVTTGVTFRRLSDGALVGNWGSEAGDCDPLVFSADGRFLACATRLSTGWSYELWSVDAANPNNHARLTAFTLQSVPRKAEFAANSSIVFWHTIDDFTTPPGVVAFVSVQDVNGAQPIRRVTARELDREQYLDSSVSPDGQHMLFAGVGSRFVSHSFIDLYDSATGLLVGPIDGPRSRVGSVAISPDGTVIAAGDQSGGIRLYRADTGNILFTVQFDDISTQCSVGNLIFTPDGSMLIASAHSNSSGGNGSIRIFDASDGSLVRTVRSGGAPGTNYPTWTALSPDGDTLAVAGGIGVNNQRGLVLYRLSDPGFVLVLDGAGAYSGGLAFSPDGRLLVTPGPDGTGRVWDTSTWTSRYAFIKSSTAVAVSPDNTLIAIGHDFGDIDLFRAADGVAAGKLLGHTSTVYTLAFAPDGRHLYSGANDGTLRIWDMPTLTQAARYDQETGNTFIAGGEAGVLDLAISPGGQYFAYGDGSTSLVVARNPYYIPPNRPIADNKVISTNEDTSGAITLSGSDVETPSDKLTYNVTLNPQHGTLTGTAPNLIYAPDANYDGPDSFQYTVTDNGDPDGTTSNRLTSDPATVSITVTPVNDAPTASSQSVTSAEDTPLTGALTGSDVDGDLLTFAKAADPVHGAVTVLLDGSFTYVPSPNYNGPDSFTFTASDGQLISSITTVTITVTPVNDAPLASSQSATTAEDTPLTGTLTGSDVDNDSLTFANVSNPVHGTVTVQPNGAYTYTPALNYNGPDSFTFRANDGTEDSASAIVSITVGPVNDAPVAAGQAVSVDENVAKTITLSAIDVDGDSLVYSILARPAHGALSGTAPNLTYTPKKNYVGADSFTFKANDGRADSNTATVSITVKVPNHPPVASAQSVSTPVGTAKGITLTATDADGDALTYTVVGPPAHGALSGSAPNFTYTPNTGYAGSDSFTFKANDGQADSNIATVSISVTAINHPPVAINDAASTARNTTKSIGVLANDSDVDGDTLTVTSVTKPGNGTAVINADKSVTYTPKRNFAGTDTFTYTISDGHGGTATATVSVTVT